jgi:hypothetical protein
MYAITVCQSASRAGSTANVGDPGPEREYYWSTEMHLANTSAMQTLTTFRGISIAVFGRQPLLFAQDIREYLKRRRG